MSLKIHLDECRKQINFFRGLFILLFLLKKMFKIDCQTRCSSLLINLLSSPADSRCNFSKHFMKMMMIEHWTWESFTDVNIESVEEKKGRR